MIKHQSIKKVFVASVFVVFFLFIFGSAVPGPYQDSPQIDVEVNDSAIVYCEYCDPLENVLPADGFSLPVWGDYGGHSNWGVYCTFNDPACEGSYCEHTGEDWNLYNSDGEFVTDEGAPVYAAANGVVVAVASDYIGSPWGNQILVRHYDPLNGDEMDVWTQYSHVDNPRTFSTGLQIYRGQQIADLGDTGLTSTGAHLHFETRLEDFEIYLWPAARYSSDCPRALAVLLDTGYREPRPLVAERLYSDRNNQVTSLMEHFQADNLIGNQYNRYFMERRAYFISILVRALENFYEQELPEAANNPFTDIDNLDAGLRSAILKALEFGILSTENNEFRPLDPISRIEALAFTVRTYEHHYGICLESPTEPYFDDIQIVATDHNQRWIWDTAQKGRYVFLVTGYVVDENRYMCPLRWTTREEAVILVNNLITRLGDETAPVINWFRINNGLPTATNWDVTLNNDVSGVVDGTEYMASENKNFEGADWLPYNSEPTFSINPVDGVKTIYLKVRNGDEARLESNVAVDSITIVLGNDVPIVTRFEINNGIEKTTNRVVTLNNEATGDPNEYQASLNSQFRGAEWQNYSEAPTFQIVTGFGANRIYFKVRNSAGVESEVVSDGIKISQNEAPFITRLKINNGAEVTNNLTVRLNNTATRNPDDYMASENEDFEGAEWLPYVHRPDFTLSEENGVKEVFFRVRKGDLVTPAVSDTIILERDETLSVTSFTIENGAESTKNREVTIKCKTTGSPTHYKISEYSNFKKSGWKPYKKEEFTYKLSKKKEVKTLYFKVKKKKVESDPVSASITLN